MLADQPGDLNRQRHERDQVHGAEQPQEQPP